MKAIYLPIATAVALSAGVAAAPSHASPPTLSESLSQAAATAGRGDIVEVRDRRRNRGHRHSHYRRDNVGSKYTWRHFGPSRHHAKHQGFRGSTRHYTYRYSPRTYYYGGSYYPYSSSLYSYPYWGGYWGGPSFHLGIGF
jgi:hypothetical protein